MSTTNEMHLEIDDYTVADQHAYFAEATRGDVKATVTLRRYSAERQDSYVLDRLADSVSGRSMRRSYRQQERADALLAELDQRVRTDLAAAGWYVTGHTAHGVDLWQQERRQASTPVIEDAPSQPTTEKVVTIKTAFTRTIRTREVTFTCQQCGKTVTQQRYPGPTPRYCTKMCEEVATHEKMLARVRKYRASKPPKSRKLELL